MASFDSIANVDEWISDYYLTNDETKGDSFGRRAEAAVKAWKAADKESATATSPWGRLSAQRNELQTALSTIDPASSSTVEAAATAIESAFGYPHPAELEVPTSAGTLAFTGCLQHKAAIVRISPITHIDQLVEATPLIAPRLDGTEVEWTATKLVTELFLSEEQPAFIVLIAGSWVILAERDSWPLGRYFGVDVALAAERNNTKNKGELQQVCAALAWENITCAPDCTTWWLETLTQSREHAVRVSESLRQAIKESIEVIGNDVLDRHREQRLPMDLDGNELAKQSLRYLYRILFLLFAEASPELQILPTGVPEYDEGYGLSNLRDQILVEPPTERAARGTYLYDSLDLLFSLVDQGHDPLDSSAPLFDATAGAEGLHFRNLAADLFKPDATAYISRVKLSNAALHIVLQNLLLTRETAGRERGFVSYATLGVTQLGQVYEGLMSYTGFIADQELLEVAPHGDPSKGSWVVPESLASTLPKDSFVQEQINDVSGTRTRNRRHRAGSFVYRQSSRDRERSASFYSPPVITEFTVGQAIEELRSSGRINCADDVLSLSICEPAMGSGAFAVEAVNQLAELYISLKQEELSEQIPAESLTEELQKVKASIALHQVYGVDLNRTAVELAEISLWLNTMTADLKAPWFGLHLRHGNSLIGATRSTVPTDTLTTKSYLSELPTHHSVESVSASIASQTSDPALGSRVHHFLVPALGWGAASESKDLKAMAPEQVKAMKAWRKSVQKGFTKKQAKQLHELSERVEVLWRFALVRLRIAEQQARRAITVWGQPEQHSSSVISREQIERELFGNLNGSYQRLRLIMNAWNALWFWPLNETESLPSREEWLSMLIDALGTANDAFTSGEKQAEGFGFSMDWEDLDFIEDLEFKASGAMKHEALMEAHPWLATVERVSSEQNFFHWDLDFAAVMAEGGFDFQIGNPPWVRPRTDFDALLSEHDPWFKLAHKPTQAAKKQRREELIEQPAVLATLARGLGETVVTAEVLGDITRYPHLAKQQPDLYRGFMERTWANASNDGVISLIHPESHFTEKKAAPLRAGAYRRLRRHWQFINSLMLFDVHDLVRYGIHVYSSPQEDPHFLSANSLYHPKSVSDSFKHDGSGELPGFKDDSDNWDLRPHRDRIATVDKDTLEVWKSVLEDPATPLLETRMVYTVNTEAAAVLEKLAAAPRIASLGLQFSRGWDESIDKKKGYFDSSWQHADSWSDVILQGPHLGVSTPMIKQPNPTMKHNQDWSEVDLEAMPEDFIPATAYLPNRGKEDYDSAYGCWDTEQKPINGSFRVSWRNMAATTGFRTLYPALIPPGSTHVHTVTSAGPLTGQRSLISAAFGSAFLVDFFIRSTGMGHIGADSFSSLPLGHENALWPIAARRYLELNCLTRAYAPLWEQITGEEWTSNTPLRNAKQRWHAQNEIDAIVALSLGVSADELCMIYRTQFPVMRRYDEQDLFDAHGRKVPKEIVKLHEKLAFGAELSAAERTWTHPQSEVSYTFEYPFASLDREADLRAAYEAFSKEL